MVLVNVLVANLVAKPVVTLVLVAYDASVVVNVEVNAVVVTYGTNAVVIAVVVHG